MNIGRERSASYNWTSHFPLNISYLLTTKRERKISSLTFEQKSQISPYFQEII